MLPLDQQYDTRTILNKKTQFSKQFLQKHTPEIRSYRVSQKKSYTFCQSGPNQDVIQIPITSWLGPDWQKM